MSQNKDSVILIGYSGHGYVLVDAVFSKGGDILGYCDREEKSENPFLLKYLGQENTLKNKKLLQEYGYAIGIGDNKIRQRIYQNLQNNGLTNFKSIIHQTATLSTLTELKKGILICAGVAINPLVRIGIGVICNTSSVIEHECRIGDFSHVAPGAVLAGNVTVGTRTFIGANSAVKQGVKIGDDVVVGAGAVIIKDIPDGATVVGNPGKIIKSKL